MKYKNTAHDDKVSLTDSAVFGDYPSDTSYASEAEAQGIKELLEDGRDEFPSLKGVVYEIEEIEEIRKMHKIPTDVAGFARRVSDLEILGWITKDDKAIPVISSAGFRWYTEETNPSGYNQIGLNAGAPRDGFSLDENPKGLKGYKALIDYTYMHGPYPIIVVCEEE